MLVDITELAFAYPARDSVPTPLLSGLNLTIHSGSFHALVGPNGCGKTTLLRLIAGLEQPSGGMVRMLGTARMTHPTAMVFDAPRLLPWWNVERNVGLGLEFGGRSKELIARVRNFYTSHVGLGGLGKRMPNELSMGQASRAGLGRALAHEADVLLLDEPFAHLDAISRQLIHVDLEALWLADGRTTVLVTHDVDEAVMLSDRVSIIRRGSDPLVETVEVDAGRPRSEVSALDPGIRAATARVWEALEIASR